ncbi:OprD family outer membrane porin [bacterium]|nr:OprD family outer membrane porin [bacterium]MBU1993323.1 OprD family outer membrane porin [bacterium]
MIDAALPMEENPPTAIEKSLKDMKQRGVIHSKVSGRFETVKELPKKANDFDEMFNYADAFGQLRLAYIDNVRSIAPTPTKTKKSASAMGGELGFNTAYYYGFGLHLSAYISQTLEFLSPEKKDINSDFVNLNQDSFAYLAEASLDYTSDLFQLKVGRVKVETPYANSDDIRMAANTFEGAYLNIDYTNKLTTQIIALNRWAGYDSQNTLSQDVFKDLYPQSAGMAIVSLTYEYAKNSEVSVWYSYIDNMSAIAYAEVIGIYFVDGESFHIDYGLQASHIQELNNSNIGGDVLGAMSILHYKGMFLGVSYNGAIVDDGNYITDGFGGGPYYTSLDEASISVISEAVPGDDLEAFRIGAGYNLKKTGVNQLKGYMVELVYGELYAEKEKIKEKNIILTYKAGKKWYVEGIYTNYNSSFNDNIFDRTLFRVNYSF